ncbi:MAG: hypothetical protein ABS81_17665 [Pseudonocardia sp. SCN 72-86]|nr:MAG: hypothetical protein ABS81_17665 [Pseudonocardia sp. SCN 72-86]
MSPFDRSTRNDRPRTPSPHPIGPHPIGPHPIGADTAGGTDSRAARRLQIADDLLDRLEALVDRHRALAPHEPGIHDALHAELVAAEVAHELAMARSALRRTPHVPALRLAPAGTDPR